MIYRFKYYFAWSVSEAALIFSGFCYNGASVKLARLHMCVDQFSWQLNARVGGSNMHTSDAMWVDYSKTAKVLFTSG